MEDINVNDIFKAETTSVRGLFSQNGVSFQIPSYQRPYSWKKEHIERLFEDVIYGINNIKNDPDSLSFLGTIILIKAEHSGEMPRSALSVVDGQQRLSSLALISLKLHDKLRNAQLSYEDKYKCDVLEKNKVQEVIIDLEDCFFEEQKMGSDRIFKKFPIITRDTDTWGYSKEVCQYQSEISNYLHQYAHHLVSEVNYEFKSLEKNQLKEGLKIIDEKITAICLPNEDKNPFPNLEVLIDAKGYSSSFLRNGTSYETIENYNHEQNTALREIIHLIILSKYFMERVTLTKVEVNDKYAFDVFESLNTTGEPLTALETFRPILIKKINNLKGHNNAYTNSDIMKVFGKIENFVQKRAKKTETENLIISSSLYLDGTKTTKQLSVQRKYLRDTFSVVENEQQVNNFVKSIADIVRFKEDIWTNSRPEKLPNAPHSEEASIFLDYLNKNNQTLTIPILTRYYIDALETKDFTLFFNIVRSLTGFTMIWRSAFNSTSNIDAAYREIMQSGYKSNKKSKSYDIDAPCHIGVTEKNPLPDLNTFCKVLKSQLEKKRILEFDEWLSKSIQADACKLSPPGVKLYLLMALNNTEWNSKTQRLERTARKGYSNFLTRSFWLSESIDSVEHIAPSNPEVRDNWDSEIYKMAGTLNTIGNLTLLPTKENQIVGNRDWTQKKAIYTCYSSVSENDLNLAIANAKEQGVNISEKAEKTIREGSHLKILSPLIEIESWTKDEIEKRTDNLARLMWEQAMEWLNQEDINNNSTIEIEALLESID